jgi:endoglucanase
MAAACMCYDIAPNTAAASTFQAGVNISGLEMNPGTLPGTANTDYAVPTSDELAYYQGKGVNIIRLPILWERLQPGVLSGNSRLNEPYLALIKQVIGAANQLGMRVIVDLHNYGQYVGNKIGNGVLTSSQFANLWYQLAGVLTNVAGVAGYDIMNEPNGMPSAAAWPYAAQNAVSAIRFVDNHTHIYVEGDDWSTAPEWQNVNGHLSINDPANRIIYSAHVYGDRDSSGTHFVWSQEVQYGVTVNTIAERLEPFIEWCAKRNVACNIGEVGVGNDSPEWNTELAHGLAAASQAGLLSFDYWAGGLWWGSYPMSIEPRNGQQRPQMDVVGQYAGD